MHDHDHSAPEATCRFCAILGGESVGDVFPSHWLDSQDYRAMISVGALVRGWTLVCPKEHSANLLGHYGQSAFWAFAAEAASALAKTYGPCTVFEHGCRDEQSLTGCGTGHAHLHLVPLDFSLASESLRFDAELEWQPCKATNIAERAGDHEYLFIADRFENSDASGLLCLLKAPRSQFFRRVIAQRIGLTDFFDYKKYPMLDIAQASAEELRLAVADRIRA